MSTVIIGNGPAAISAVEAIRAAGFNENITVVSKEPFPAYTPCFLAQYVSGEAPKEKLYYRDGRFYERNKVDVILGVGAEGVDVDSKEVNLSDGKSLRYDKLLIAAGAVPVIPPIDGIVGDGVYTFKSLNDADKIIKALNDTKSVVVMGAGFIGLEIAEALTKRDCHVTVVEKESHILPRMLDQKSAEFVVEHLEKNGVKIVAGTSITRVQRDKNGSLTGIETDRSGLIKCDALVVAVGIRPNIAIVKDSSILTATGIVVDDHLRTNIPDVYAAGDIAEIEMDGKRKLSPIHINAVKTGKVAGANMVGIDCRVHSLPIDMNVIKLFGMYVASFGVPKGEKVIELYNGKTLRKIFLDRDEHIKGVQLIGSIEKAGVYLSAMQKNITPHVKIKKLISRPNYAVILENCI